MYKSFADLESGLDTKKVISRSPVEARFYSAHENNVCLARYHFVSKTATPQFK